LQEEAIPIQPTTTVATSSKLIRTLIELAIIVAAVIFGLLIRWQVYEATLVISGSMKPTLQVGDRLLVDHRTSLHHHYKRGDIIIFDTPESWGDKDVYIKRLIGLPGEKIEIAMGHVVINGEVLNENYLQETPLEEDMPAVQLGPDEYFVMGDNRNNSSDSREHGPIHDADVKGRAIYVVAPFGRFGQLPYVAY
jgi:signal peptidase I